MQTVVAQIPWSHNLEILRVKSKEERLWYIEKTIENGWSKNILAHQIDTNLYMRQVENKKISNFQNRLEESQSELMLETMKDSYVFDFLDLQENIKDETLKIESDKPTISLLLCRHKNNIIAEYTLRDMEKPMGVSEYSVNDYLPQDLKDDLPSLEELINTIEIDVAESK